MKSQLKNQVKLHHLRSQLKNQNQNFLAKPKTRDTQKSYLCQTLPTDILEAVHPQATKAKDPRRDPRKKAVDEVVRVKGKDHKSPTNSGALGHTTQKDMLSNARLAEDIVPIARQEQ